MPSVLVNSDLLNAVEKEACENDFFEFIKSFWSVIIKETPVYNWHIDYLCKELQKLSVSIIKREQKPYDLIINIPPGTTKSTICTIMFPVWLWIKDPSIKIITNSYSASLSTEHAIKSRDILLSDKFKRLFPRIKLRIDKSAKTSYENIFTGARYTTSTGGTITGKHAHIIINDDPLNTSQSNSTAEIHNANEHTKTLASRKIDKKNTPTVTIMQRLHEMDVTGYLLSNKAENIKHICLPATATDKVKPDYLKEKYTEGFLDPIRLDASVLIEAKADLGSYGYANQFMQDSSPKEGGILKVKWFPIIEWEDDFNNLVWNTVIDPAYTSDKTNDESGFMMYAITNNTILIRHAEGVYKEFPDLVKYTASYPMAHGYTDKSKIYVEPKASGKSLVQQIKYDTTLNIIEDFVPIKDKTSRANDISPKCEAGRVKLIKGAWNDAFLNQIKTFPKSEQDGLIDNLIMVCHKLDTNSYSSIKRRRR